MVPPNNNNTQNHENHHQQQENSSSESKKPDQQQPRDVVKCPRCDSPNTKFCYYNNYSLTQPRHFCKTCRRYWTNGGSLRNVPIGGGCRKKQKLKNSSLSSSSSLSSLTKYSSSPSLDFHLGGLLPLPLPLPFTSKPYFYNQFPSNSNTCVPTTSPSSFHLDPSTTSNPMMGLNLYPFSSTSNGNGFINENAIQGMNFMNVNTSTITTTTSTSTSTSLAIESLSCMNQDLHLKLQQQRLATMFGGDDDKKDGISGNDLVSQVSGIEKPQPILFQNLENSKAEMFQGVGDDGDMRKVGPSPSEWFFEMNSYSSVMTPTRNNDGVCMNGDHDNGNNISNNWINNGGVHAWGDMQPQQQLPYSALP